MSESTRRGFLKVAGAGAAAGVAVVAVGAATKAGAKPADAAGASAAATSTGARGTGALVAYVKDVRGGEVALMVGETEVVVHDPELVNRLIAARGRTASA